MLRFDRTPLHQVAAKRLDDGHNLLLDRVDIATGDDGLHDPTIAVRDLQALAIVFRQPMDRVAGPSQAQYALWRHWRRAS